MSVFPSSSIGLPSGVDYRLPPSLGDSTRSYSVAVAPSGLTSVTGPVLTGTPFVANTTGQFGQFTNQNITFDLPCGMSSDTFLDPNSTCLSFTMSYSTSRAGQFGTTAGPVDHIMNAVMQLIGSGASWFDQLQLFCNSTPVETISQYGLLQNYLLANTVDTAERWGLSTTMGCDNNSGNGINLSCSAITTYRYNFCIPLLSVIGINSEKLIPIGSLNAMQLVMTTASQHPIASYCTAVTAPGDQPIFSTGITLDNFFLNMKYIQFDAIAASLLSQSLQDGKWFIKAVTYTNANATIMQNTGGAVQLLLQIRNSSVKSILAQCGTAPSAACANGYFDAIGINTNARQIVVGGSNFPNKPLNDMNYPALAYSYLIQAMGGSIPKALGTMCERYSYNSHLSTFAGADSSINVPALGVRSIVVGSDEANLAVAKYPNQHYWGFDMEKCTGNILFNGVNTRAAPPVLNLYLAVACPANVTVNAFGMSDVVLVIDVVSKQLTAFV